MIQNPVSSPTASIQPVGPADPPLTWEMPKPHVVFRWLTLEQLDMLEDNYASPKLALCTAAASFALAFGIVLFTVALDGRQTTLFFVAFLVTFIATLVLALDAREERKKAKRVLARVRTQAAGQAPPSETGQ
jgi:peptidoglycan/LPS O-acetylase OafA/YrhL